MHGDSVGDKFIPPHPLNTAVLFLVFNRLDTAKQVFKAIREAKPPRLYIAADGARANKEGEDKKVEAVREFILSHIDWDCEIKTFFQDVNIGCGPNVKSSIDWFFDNEEMGIILEDDVVPEESFFPFCEELLIKYKDDSRIGMISGNNHIGNDTFSESYTFSKYKGCWGWATWRRAWKNMDFEMTWIESKSRDVIIKNMGYGKPSIEHWSNAIDNIRYNIVSAWDWQWYFSLASQNQLCIFPRFNLVSNIGFGLEATHTFGKANKSFLLTKKLDFPLVHPLYILGNDNYDKSFEAKKIKKPFTIKNVIPKKIKRLIKKIIYDRR